MLKKMRSDFKKYSWTLWIVIVAFIVGFHMTGAFSSGQLGESDLVSISGDIIKVKEYSEYTFRAIDNYKRQFKENFNKSLITQMRIPEQILQTLINSNIIHKEASKFNITVSDSELREKIMNLFHQDGKFIGYKAYKDFLDRQGIKVEKYENDLKKDIIRDKFMELVTASLVINSDTLKEIYKKDKDSVDLDFISLRLDRIKKKFEATDKELKAYYEKNKLKFKSPEKRAAYIIAFKFNDFKKDIVITDQELYEYFKNNRKMFFLPGKTKVSRIFLEYNDNSREDILKKAEVLKELLNPKNFSEKAKAFSQDQKAKEGGDYGYWGWKNFTPQERNFIDKLKQDQISPVVDTLKGFSIILISEKVTDRQDSFDNVKKRISDTIEKGKLREMAIERSEKIYTSIKNEADIKKGAEKLGVTAITTTPLTNGESIKDIDEMGYISRKMFTLKEKEISFPVEFINGISIVQLLKIEESAVEAFEVAKTKVKQNLFDSRKADILAIQATEISRKLNTMKDEAVVKKYLEKEKIKSTNFNYKRGNQLSYFPPKEGLDDIIFSLQEARYASPIRFKDAMVIVKVKIKTITGIIDFESDKAEFYKKKVEELQNNYFASYIINKRKKYEIRLNQKLFNEVRDKIIARYK